MSSPDDLLRLWQDGDSQEVNHTMWVELIEERRVGFHELVRAENRTEYLVDSIAALLWVALSSKAKYRLEQVGCGLLAATMVVTAIIFRIDHRRERREIEGSLREHLQALLDDYDRRIRFLRRGQFWIGVPFFSGVFAWCMGTPGRLTPGHAWILTTILLVVLWGGCRLSYVRREAKILKKREQAERLLSEIPGEDQSVR